MPVIAGLPSNRLRLERSVPPVVASELWWNRALSLRDNGQVRNARRFAAAHAFRHAERAATAAWLAPRAYTQKRCALCPCRGGSQRERPPAAVTSSSGGVMGGWESWLSARDLFHDIKRRGAALLEIAESEDAGAKLCERPVLGQCKTAHLLSCLFFAGGFDFAPVVLGIPLAVGPMLHLVSSLCLHRVPPMFRARGGYKSFLATIGRYASTIVNSPAVVLPLSNRGRRRSTQARCPRRDCRSQEC